MTQNTSKFLLAYALVKAADYEQLHFFKGQIVFDFGHIDDESIRMCLSGFHRKTRTWGDSDKSNGNEEYYQLLFKSLLTLELDERIVIIYFGGYDGLVNYPDEQHKILIDYYDSEFRTLFEAVLDRLNLKIYDPEPFSQVMPGRLDLVCSENEEWCE